MVFWIFGWLSRSLVATNEMRHIIQWADSWTPVGHTHDPLSLCMRLCVAKQFALCRQLAKKHLHLWPQVSLSLFFNCALVLQWIRERERREREKGEGEKAESKRNTHTHVVELWQVQRATFLANGIIISASDDSRSLCLCLRRSRCRCLQPASTTRTATRPSVPLPSGSHCRCLRHRLATFLSPSPSSS